MKKNEKGFSGVVVLLLLIVIGLIGFASWYVWQKQNIKSRDSVENKTEVVSEPFALDESKIPKDWSINRKEDVEISLKNDSTNCQVSAVRSKLSPELTPASERVIADKEQDKGELNSLRPKGFIIEELPKTELTIDTTKGQQVIETQPIKVSGPNTSNFYTKNYFAVENDSYTVLRLSCVDESTFLTAQQALMAIKFIKY